MQDKGIRLQKFLAERGVASRRRCAQYIVEGHVRVNDRLVTEPGTRIHPEKDKVTIDGQLIVGRRETFRTIMLYKPRGYVCSASAEQGRTVYDLIKGVKERLVPVGRLDKNSEGLLLMSNNGDLVNRLTHPRYEQEKAYVATVSGNVDSANFRKLRSRLLIDGYRIQPAKVKILRKVGDSGSHVHGGVGREKPFDSAPAVAKAIADKQDRPGRFLLEFVLKEGRKRQIRRMCEQAELTVHRLVRVRIRNLTLSGLKHGQWRDLNSREVEELNLLSAQDVQAKQYRERA